METFEVYSSGLRHFANRVKASNQTDAVERYVARNHPGAHIIAVGSTARAYWYDVYIGDNRVDTIGSRLEWKVR